MGARWPGSQLVRPDRRVYGQWPRLDGQVSAACRAVRPAPADGPVWWLQPPYQQPLRRRQHQVCRAGARAEFPMLAATAPAYQPAVRAEFPMLAATAPAYQPAARPEPSDVSAQATYLSHQVWSAAA